MPAEALCSLIVLSINLSALQNCFTKSQLKEFGFRKSCKIFSAERECDKNFSLCVQDYIRFCNWTFLSFFYSDFCDVSSDHYFCCIISSQKLARRTLPSWHLSHTMDPFGTHLRTKQQKLWGLQLATKSLQCFYFRRGFNRGDTFRFQVVCSPHQTQNSVMRGTTRQQEYVWRCKGWTAYRGVAHAFLIITATLIFNPIHKAFSKMTHTAPKNWEADELKLPFNSSRCKYYQLKCDWHILSIFEEEQQETKPIFSQYFSGRTFHFSPSWKGFSCKEFWGNTMVLGSKLIVSERRNVEFMARML